MPRIVKYGWVIVVMLLAAVSGHAQSWSGILNTPTTVCDTTPLSACGSPDWLNAGLPGYNPTGVLPSATWTQFGSTILASTYGNGVSDATAGIQAALNSCGTNHYILLSPGTFLANLASLIVPSNCVLRGAGANNTIINSTGTHKVIIVGNGNQPTFGSGGLISVTSSPIIGSTTITIPSGNIGSAAIGKLAWISQLNSNYVTAAGSEGLCTPQCDNGSSGTRTEGQTVYVTGVNTGTDTVTFTPALEANLTSTPTVKFWTPKVNAGVEALQVVSNNTGNGADFQIFSCYECWIDGVEGNYADGVQAYLSLSSRSQITNSYFSSGFNATHSPGTDDTVQIDQLSSQILVQNNILERLHSGIIIESSVYDVVVGYNYCFGDWDSGSPSANFACPLFHGSNPMFVLSEGNISALAGQDGIWGSNTNNTFFRDWIRGTDYKCNPTNTTTRQTPTCTPTGYPTQYGTSSGTTGAWIGYEEVNGFNPTFETFNPNLVGSVLGSTESLNLKNTSGSSVPNNDVAWSICGGTSGTPCGSGSRNSAGGSAGFIMTWGYGEAGDSGGTTNTNCPGGGPYSTPTNVCNSQVPQNSALVHGVYDYEANTTTWSGSLTHTLPASFYLTSKPNWWGSGPFPAIGPDVIGGSFVNGHVNNIPAKTCYESLGGSIGGGSPLTNFNAAVCYGGAAPPNPPSGLHVVIEN